MAKFDILGLSESCSCMSQISFNCTLIAHENVTTDFFCCCCLGLFCFILIFILCKLCLVVFIASKDMGLSENVLLF